MIEEGSQCPSGLHTPKHAHTREYEYMQTYKSKYLNS